MSFFEHRFGHYALLLAAAIPLFFWNLGGATLWDLDEGRNLTCALEMMLSGNWIVPTFNGVLRDHKPALLYWLQIFSYQIGGVNEAMGRLPSATAALLTLFVAYEIGRRMFSKTTGLLAALVAATSPMLIGAARFANPDALLNLFSALTLLLFWVTLHRPSAWGFLAAGIAMGLGMLAKGPIAVVAPGAIVVAFLVWERRLGFLFDRRIVLTWLAFLAVAAPWYALVGAATKGLFLKGFFWGHNFERAAGVMENHSGGVWYYPLVLLVGTMPWSLFLFGSMRAAVWSCFRPANPTEPGEPGALATGGTAPSQSVPPVAHAPGSPSRWSTFFQSGYELHADQAGRGGPAGYRFLLLWILAYMAIFTIARTKLPNYILPVIVPCSLVTARFLERWRKETLELPAWFPVTSAVGLGVIGLAIGGGLAAAGGVGELAVLRQRFFPALVPFAPLGLVFVAAGGVLVWAARTGRRTLYVRGLVVSALVLLAPLAAYATAALNGAKAPSAIARHTPAYRPEVDQRILALNVGHLPSINFYTRRDIDPVDDIDKLAFFADQPLPVIGLLRENDAAAFQAKYPEAMEEVGRFPDLYRRTSVVVMVNRK